MKKFISLALVLSAIAMQAAFAEDSVPADLIPAETVDEMIANNDFSALDSSVNTENTDTQADLNDFDRPGFDHGHGVICFAKNMHGRVFRARGYNAYQAQRRALEECRQFSRSRCYPRGCRR